MEKIHIEIALLLFLCLRAVMFCRTTILKLAQLPKFTLRRSSPKVRFFQLDPYGAHIQIENILSIEDMSDYCPSNDSYSREI